MAAIRCTPSVLVIRLANRRLLSHDSDTYLLKFNNCLDLDALIFRQKNERKTDIFRRRPIFRIMTNYPLFALLNIRLQLDTLRSIPTKDRRDQK